MVPNGLKLFGNVPFPKQILILPWIEDIYNGPARFRTATLPEKKGRKVFLDEVHIKNGESESQQLALMETSCTELTWLEQMNISWESRSSHLSY